ncbi:MAG: urease accessory protein UreF [Verrucomicrobiota bacterium]
MTVMENPKLEIGSPREGRDPKSESDAPGGRVPEFGPPSDCVPRLSDFTLWQLVDSAFPTGGFAHSAGLEAAWQHGEVRNRTELLSFLETSLAQLGRAALPFVTAAWDAPERLLEWDELCDVFTTNHVANRASRLQGKAFLMAVERIFVERGVQADGDSALKRPEGRAPFAHFGPVFGASLRALGMDRPTASRMFFFNHLRGLIAAAVRLNIVGPMEAQGLQHGLSSKAEEIFKNCEALTLDYLAQTAPLLDLWQGAQDRLYSRLFQS